MQQCWLEDADRRPHFRDLVTTISNMLESIAGYLDLSRSFSLIKRVKKDHSHSPRPKRTEMPILEDVEEEEEEVDNGEQSEGGEGAEEAVQRDPAWEDSYRRGAEEEKKGKSIRGQVMESIGYASQETAM